MSSFYSALTKALDYLSIENITDSADRDKATVAMFLFFNRLDPSLIPPTPVVDVNAPNDQQLLYGYSFLASVIKAICEVSTSTATTLTLVEVVNLHE